MSRIDRIVHLADSWDGVYLVSRSGLVVLTRETDSAEMQRLMQALKTVRVSRLPRLRKTQRGCSLHFYGEHAPQAVYLYNRFLRWPELAGIVEEIVDKHQAERRP